MRMWNVPPELMCRQHLLGEHLEMHMFAGCLLTNKSISGYIRNGLVEVQNIIPRHDELVKEMLKRGYHHYSHLPTNLVLSRYIDVGNVDSELNLQILKTRCPECRKRMEKQ